MERFQVANYLDIVQEHVEPWSYLKFPFYKKWDILMAFTASVRSDG
jgi:coenzyme F420-reducing hydrogenase alpha subunit